MTERELVVGPHEDEADNQQLGLLLEQFRSAALLSRTDAADKLEISSEYLRLIELGKRTPPIETTKAMLLLYNIILVQGPSTLYFEKYTVRFTSRIREKRRTSGANGSTGKKYNYTREQLQLFLRTAAQECDDRLKQDRWAVNPDLLREAADMLLIDQFQEE